MIDYEITIDVRGFSDEKKRLVISAFHNIGIKWKEFGEYHQPSHATLYTNTTACRRITGFLMYSGASTVKATHTFNELMGLAGVHEYKEQAGKRVIAKDAAITWSTIRGPDLQEAIDATCSNISVSSEGMDNTLLCGHLDKLLKEQRKRLGIA